MPDHPGTPVPGWVPPPRPAPVSHIGRHGRLDPLVPAHAAALHAAAAGHDALWDFMPYGPFDTAGRAAWVAAVAGRPDPLFLALTAAGAAGPAGVMSLMRITPEAGSIEVGHICLAPPLQRSAAATEAIFLLADWAFGAGYRRFEWKCDALNLPSRRAAQRLGFAWEGIFRQAAVVKGRNRDTAWFAMTDGDFRRLRPAYARWLDPANFDAQGRQRARLSDLTAPHLFARDPALA
jgi:RimJ/RimL family protein N-acetyltransferase